MKIERIGEEISDDKAIPWTASTSERSKREKSKTLCTQDLKFKNMKDKKWKNVPIDIFREMKI